MALAQQQAAAGSRPSKAPSSLGSTSLSAAADDQQLLETPLDLVCPITLQPFQDPVINAVGQVYERGAIERHLLQAAVSSQQPTDPISNAVLPSLDLVSVWPMRSRAAEYRDSTIRACLQRATAPDCTEPVKFLRRAAELVLSGGDPGSHSTRSRTSRSGGAATPPALPPADASPPSPLCCSCAAAPAAADPAAAAPAAAGAGVPGMTWDFAQYLAAHQGPQYDALALKYFGHILRAAGCSDAASNVFYRLLLEAEEREQQAEYLQLCLDSATQAAAGGASPTPPSSSGSSDARPGPAHKAGPASVNPAIIRRLADFTLQQHRLSPKSIIQMLSETPQQGSAMALQLCQVLLARAAAAAAAAGPAANAEAALQLPGGLGGVLEVLLELVELGHGQLEAQVQQLAAQVRQLRDAQGAGADGVPAAASGAAGAGPAAAASPEQHAAAAAAAAELGTQAGAAAAGGRAHPAAGAGAQRRRGGGRAHVWRGGKHAGALAGRMLRVAAAGTLAVAGLAGGNHPALRLARVGPLLFLLRAGL